MASEDGNEDGGRARKERRECGESKWTTRREDEASGIFGYKSTWSLSKDVEEPEVSELQKLHVEWENFTSFSLFSNGLLPFLSRSHSATSMRYSSRILPSSHIFLHAFTHTNAAAAAATSPSSPANRKHHARPPPPSPLFCPPPPPPRPRSSVRRAKENV